VQLALERDYWTPEQWRDWQQKRLDGLLRRAATEVPYYRDQWNRRRERGSTAQPERLSDWPVLEKESLRTAGRAFVAEDCQIKKMFHDHTSGSTGKSLDLWLSRQTVRSWYALFEARCRRWYGVSRHDRWGMLGGQLVVPVAQRRPPFWVWNASLNQLYLSAYHLAPDLIPHYLEALRKHRVTYLLGYTSALHALAVEILESGLQSPQMKVVITNAEPVYDHQRQAIAAAFGCPVRETYGMAEIVAAASECEAGRLHFWPETGVVEVLNDGKPAADGEPGDLVCTGLMNFDMPLVRYRAGDRAVLPRAAAPCPCGRTLPAFASIEGRLDDMVYTHDGRAVGRLDPVFKGRLKVREAQIVQERLDQIRVRYVPAPGYTEADGQSIISRLQDRLGPVTVVLEPLKEIPRGAGGKFRSVICNLSAEEKKRIRRGRVEELVGS
jgi:phenylacetate-CoA ligase